MRRTHLRWGGVALITAAALLAITTGERSMVAAEPANSPASSSLPLVPVRHMQGGLHGFLALRTLDGSTVADGDSLQTIVGDRVTVRTVFHFKDGSISEETAVFTEHGSYRLVTDHLVQHGPTFQHPMTMDIDMARQRVTVTTVGDHGESKVDDKKMELPANLCNGIQINLLEDIDAKQLPFTLAYVAATPAPRLVKLVVGDSGTVKFGIAGSSRTAIDLIVKTDIGGIAGLIAPLVGKQPPDAHVWVSQDAVPVFLRSDAPMYAGGPLLRTELTSPQW
jgi:hypothetical protein